MVISTTVFMIIIITVISSCHLYKFVARTVHMIIITNIIAVNNNHNYSNM